MNRSDAKRILLEKFVRGELARGPIPRAGTQERESGLPLSLSQEQVWLRSQAAAGMPPLYNETITIHRTGPLSVPTLQRALLEILRRHEAWRTTFEMREGQVRQVIHPVTEEFPLSIVDLSETPQIYRDGQALRLASEQARVPFDLQRGPLIRALLVSLDDREHRLFVNMHQIITDGISVYEVLPTELATLYESFTRGTPSHLPGLPLQFADFALWQRDWLRSGVQERQLDYWRKQLGSETPVLPWPTDRPRPPVQTYRGALKAFTTGRKRLDMLNETARNAGVSLFAMLVAHLAALLHAYTSQDEIVLGTLAPCGRHRLEFQKLLGYFLNPVALRLEISRRVSFRELMEQAQKVIVEAISHADVPFECMVTELGFAAESNRHPLFQIAISLAPSLAPLPPGWDMTPMDVESGGARWDLYLELSERPEGLMGRAQYNPDLFEATTLAAMLKDFQVLLQAAASNPNQKLSDLLVRLATSDPTQRNIYAYERMCS
jgi:surfactin family lipopeptide synthetase A